MTIFLLILTVLVAIVIWQFMAVIVVGIYEYLNDCELSSENEIMILIWWPVILPFLLIGFFYKVAKNLIK